MVMSHERCVEMESENAFQDMHARRNINKNRIEGHRMYTFLGALNIGMWGKQGKCNNARIDLVEGEMIWLESGGNQC